MVKTIILDMAITIGITSWKTFSSTSPTTVLRTANGALTSGIRALVQILAQIFNVILVSNVLNFCCIRNSIYK